MPSLSSSLSSPVEVLGYKFLSAAATVMTYDSKMHTQEGSSKNETIEDFKKRLEQSDRLLCHARQEMSLSQHMKACQQLKLKRPSFNDQCSLHK
jgi:hypothetical protein